MMKKALTAVPEKRVHKKTSEFKIEDAAGLSFMFLAVIILAYMAYYAKNFKYVPIVSTDTEQNETQAS